MVMKGSHTAAKCIAIVACALAWLPASAAVKHVLCDKGQSLQEAVSKARGTGAPLEVFVSGTCNENVDIERDISIQGDSAVISGRVRVFGPHSAVLSNLTITGPGNGLIILGGRTRILNSDISYNEGSGLVVRHNGTAILRGTQVSHNAGRGIEIQASLADIANSNVLENADSGIVANDRSHLFFSAGRVSDNEQLGIIIANNSSISLSEAQVTGNQDIGIFMNLSSSGVFNNNEIADNARQGLEVDDGSSADVVGGSIHNNAEFGMYLSFHAAVRLFGPQIFHNGLDGVILMKDSGLVVGEGTAIYENGFAAISCLDKESSAEIAEPWAIWPIICVDQEF